jgi:hypothetical protein
MTTVINNEMIENLAKENPFELAYLLSVLKFNLIDMNIADFDGSIIDERALENGIETREYYFAPDFISDFAWMLSMTAFDVYDACQNF